MLHSLALEEIRARAPSVFATEPWNGNSHKYRFIPTSDIIGEMMMKGFRCVQARQTKTRLEGKRDFARHVLRFRHSDAVARGGDVPEIVLLNSHDGTSSYRVMLGFFRIACENGLIVCSSMMDEIATRHSGGEDVRQQVIDASYRVVENAPKVMAQIEQWKQTPLIPQATMAYAKAALELRDTLIKPEPELLLQAERPQDQDDTVWNVFNRVQEHLIKGGLDARDSKGRNRATRRISSVNEDTKLNRALWRLTEELAAKVSA